MRGARWVPPTLQPTLPEKGRGYTERGRRSEGRLAKMSRTPRTLSVFGICARANRASDKRNSVANPPSSPIFDLRWPRIPSVALMSTICVRSLRCLVVSCSSRNLYWNETCARTNQKCNVRRTNRLPLEQRAVCYAESNTPPPSPFPPLHCALFQ